MDKCSRGFSLIELMIAIVIVGVLAAVAIPSYGNYVLRSNRTAGKTAIMKIVGRQESLFSDQKSYGDSLADLDSNWGSGTNFYVKQDGDIVTTTGSDRIYQVTLHPFVDANVANCTASGTLPTWPGNTITQYTVMLTPMNRQLKDTQCARLCFSSLQTKGDSGPASDCWTR